MQTKLEQVSELLEQTARSVSTDSEKWAAFLSTAARMYKYGVDDQLLIHAQYPDATACAAISVWNKLKRWVKRGTKGLALLDKTGGRVRLKYVFNVSDTQAGRGEKDIYIWKLGAEHGDAVGRVLSANFGVKPDGELSAQLMNAAAKAARDNCRAYFPSSTPLPCRRISSIAFCGIILPGASAGSRESCPSGSSRNSPKAI